jgi:hypothetical protein
MNNFPLQGSPYNFTENDNYIEKKKRNTTIRNKKPNERANIDSAHVDSSNIGSLSSSVNKGKQVSNNVKNMIGSIHNNSNELSDDIDLADFNPPPHAEIYSMRNQSQSQIQKGIEIANMGELNPNVSNYHVTQLDVGEEKLGPVNVEGFASGEGYSKGTTTVTYTGANNYVGPYKQTVPYYTQMSQVGNKDQLLEKLNYMIHLLEEQQDEKTGHVMEELILYSFLGVFLIFIVDSFARAGKYKR